MLLEWRRLGFVAVILLAAGCTSEDVGPSGEELQQLTQPVAENTNQTLFGIQEALDIASGVLADEGISIDGAPSVPDGCEPIVDRLYIQDDTHYDTLIYSGTISLDYSSSVGCTTTSSRSGTIANVFTYIINYLHKTTFSVRQAIKLKSFTRDQIRMDGEMVSHSSTESGDTINITNLRVAGIDGSALVNGKLNSSREYAEDMENSFRRRVSGKMEYRDETGKAYTAEVVEPVMYSYECNDKGGLAPLSGKIRLQLPNWNATIDYGNGDCDNFYTITIKGNTRTYEL